MDASGNIYMLENNPNRQEVIKELDLIEIPREEENVVLNLSTKDKISWYNNKRLELMEDNG